MREIVIKARKTKEKCICSIASKPMDICWAGLCLTVVFLNHECNGELFLNHEGELTRLLKKILNQIEISIESMEIGSNLVSWAGRLALIFVGEGCSSS